MVAISESSDTGSAIGARLKYALRSKAMTQRDLASLTGVSSSTASAWLAGKNISLKSLYKISHSLEISVNWLVLGLGSMDRATLLKLIVDEEALVYLSRTVSADFSTTLSEFIEALSPKDRELGKELITKTAVRLLEEGDAAVAIVLLDGTVVEASHSHDELLGITREERERNRMTAFNFVAPEFQSELKRAIGDVQLKSKGGFNYRELIHQRTGKRIPVVTKSALIDYKNNTAIKVIIKPLEA